MGSMQIFFLKGCLHERILGVNEVFLPRLRGKIYPPLFTDKLIYIFQSPHCEASKFYYVHY